MGRKRDHVVDAVATLSGSRALRDHERAVARHPPTSRLQYCQTAWPQASGTLAAIDTAVLTYNTDQFGTRASPRFRGIPRQRMGLALRQTPNNAAAAAGRPLEQVRASRAGERLGEKEQRITVALRRHCRSPRRAGGRDKRNRATPSGRTAELGRLRKRPSLLGRRLPASTITSCVGIERTEGRRDLDQRAVAWPGVAVISSLPAHALLRFVLLDTDDEVGPRFGNHCRSSTRVGGRSRPPALWCCYNLGAQRAPPAVPVSSPSRCAPSIVERLDVGEIRGCTGHQSAPVSLSARYFACAKCCASCRSMSRRGVTTRWGLSLLHLRGHVLPGMWSAGVWIGDGTTAADAHRPIASRTLNSAARALAAGTSGTAAK